MRERVGRVLEIAVLLGALATIPLTIAQERGVVEAWVSIGDWAVWIMFFVEYAIMIALSAGEHWRYARRNWLDAAIIVLSFPALPAVLALVRLARLARLTRLLRVTVVTARGIKSLRFVLGRPGLIQMTATSALLVLAGSCMLLLLEPQTVGGRLWDAFWWSIVTVTTVGYGDIVPVTVWGRIAGVGLMLAGLGLVSTLAAAIAAHFVDQDNDIEFKRVEDRLERIERLIGELVRTGRQAS